MRHVLAPTGEDPVGKVVIEGNRVPVVEAAIDPVVSQSLNRVVERG
jgi:cobalamin biosynthesis protein CbiD